MTELASVAHERVPGEPVSPGERLFWSAERHGAAAPPFVECPRHLPIFLRLSNRLDVPALASALREIVERHDPLRSTFHETSRGLVRVPHAADAWPAAAIGMVSDAAEGQVAGILRDELERPFDLETGPPLRARLLRIDDDEHVLSIVVHHIVFDGWSAGVLLRELALLYGRYTNGSGGTLPDLPLRHADYVARQRAKLDSDEARRATDYWRQHLRGAAPLPVGTPSEADSAAPSSASARFTIDPERAASLRRLGQERRFTFAVVLAALFKLLLRRRSGCPDVVVGMPVVDRPLSPYEDLIGLFLNMVLLRTDLSGEPDVPETLARVRDTFRGAYVHGHLPYAALCERLPEAEGLPRVVFNLMNFRRVAAELPGLVVRQIPVEAQLPSQADLSLHVGETNGGLSGRFIYKTSLFGAEDIRELSREFDSLVDEALSPHAAGAVN